MMQLHEVFPPTILVLSFFSNLACLKTEQTYWKVVSFIVFNCKAKKEELAPLVQSDRNSTKTIPGFQIARSAPQHQWTHRIVGLHSVPTTHRLNRAQVLSLRIAGATCSEYQQQRSVCCHLTIPPSPLLLLIVEIVFTHVVVDEGLRFYSGVWTIGGLPSSTHHLLLFSQSCSSSALLSSDLPSPLLICWLWKQHVVIHNSWAWDDEKLRFWVFDFNLPPSSPVEVFKTS